MDKKHSYKLFNAIATSYDKTNRILSFGIDLYWRKKLCSHLPITDQMQLIDLATGTGDQLFTICKKHPNIKGVGIDLSEKMLGLARRKNKCGNIRFEVGDAQGILFKTGRFDIATMSFGIRNVLSPIKCLKEIHRVLKNNGSCFILEFSMPSSLLIKHSYLFYLRNILPKIGKWLSSHHEAYTYLNKTIESFPKGSDFLKLMQEAGFQDTKQIPLTFGIASIYIGYKK